MYSTDGYGPRVMLEGCMQPLSNSSITAPGYQAPVLPRTVIPQTPCASRNEAPLKTTPVEVDISPVLSIGSTRTTGDIQVPITDFIANQTSGRRPLAISFSDRSTLAPTNWSWNFGDGSISYEKNPVHVYGIPGTYAVRLTASNQAGGNTATKVYYITVMPRRFGGPG